MWEFLCSPLRNNPGIRPRIYVGYNSASTLMVSQLPVSSWHEVIGEPTIADAICDRIVHGAHRINLEGDSVRKLYAERANRDPAERLGH